MSWPCWSPPQGPEFVPRNNYRTSEGPPGLCHLWGVVFPPTPAPGFSQRPTQASPGPARPPSHCQHRKSALGEDLRPVQRPHISHHRASVPQGPAKEQDRPAPDPQGPLGRVWPNWLFPTTWSQTLGLRAHPHVCKAQISRPSQHHPVLGAGEALPGESLSRWV